MTRYVRRWERALVVVVLRAFAREEPDTMRGRCFTVAADEIERRDLRTFPPIPTGSDLTAPPSHRPMVFESLRVAMLWSAAREMRRRLAQKHRAAELMLTEGVSAAVRALSSQREDAPSEDEIVAAAQTMVDFDPGCAP